MTREQLNELRKEILTLKDFNDVLERFPKDTIYNFLVEQNKDYPNDIAINYLGKEITFEELLTQIGVAADALLSMGVKPGEHVCLSPLTTPEGIISFYAINKIGAVAHFINPAMSKHEILEHIKEAEAKLFMTFDLFYSQDMKKAFEDGGIKQTVLYSLMDSTPFGFNGDTFKNFVATFVKRKANKVSFDEKTFDWATFMEKGKKYPNGYTHPYEPDADAAVAYTSGTTGMSKGVVTTNEAFNAVPLILGMSVESVERGDGAYNSLPLWIYYSLGNSIHEALCLGVTCELDPLFDPKNFAKRYNQYKFNHWNGIPHYAKASFSTRKAKKLDYSKIKTLSTGGDFLLNSVRDLINGVMQPTNPSAVVRNGIGLNEVLGGFAFQYGDHVAYESAGKPCVGNRVKVVNPENGELCTTNESGELYLCTPTMMKGYFKRPDLTEEVFEYDEDGVKWFKTGDVGKIDEFGELYPEGRMDRIEMTLDETGLPTKLFPEKLKLVMTGHEALLASEGLVVPDEKRITKMVLFAVLRDGVEDTPELRQNIMAYAKYYLPTYMVPTDIFFVDEMPVKGTSFKVDYPGLMNLYQEMQGKSRVRK